MAVRSARDDARGFDAPDELHAPLLTQRIQQGDDAAFVELYRTRCEPLRRLASGYLIRFDSSAERSCDAADIVNDVFTSLWDRRAELKLRRPIDWYLRSAVHRRVLHECRRQLRERDQRITQDHLAQSPSADEYVLAEERTHVIAAAVGRLPRKCGGVFRLYAYDDLSYRAIGERFGISVRTVEAHIRHARGILADSLPEEYRLPHCGSKIHGQRDSSREGVSGEQYDERV